ncbi:hypothetical protein EVAR_64730_1 [Eumeta japonica]|uniref:Uncharacterized protein n=1 Tax=Eumeta variegata TaxID=151549 RepID=A0A4C1Z7C9_EUMVA|nr:hypothetical protein EVAR_64730_1 [Eumeta japonica]
MESLLWFKSDTTGMSENSGSLFPSPLPHFPSIGCLIPTQEAGNASATPMRLRVVSGGDDRLLSTYVRSPFIFKGRTSVRLLDYGCNGDFGTAA